MNFLQQMNAALHEAMDRNPKVLVLGQLVKYGLGGLTAGLHERHPRRVITYPVCENLMNGTAMGLALAGWRPVVVHERMDFLAVGMDPLVNHIPVWPAREPMELPVTVIAVVGKGKGQGPQHSKNLTPWFRSLEGWTVREPNTPQQAHGQLYHTLVYSTQPVMYVAHREFFAATGRVHPPQTDRVGLCGASKRHEEEFYR